MTNEIIGYYAPTLFFLICFGLLYFFPPKHINNWVGYRTNGSMKNQKNWTFSQKYAAKWVLKGSCILLILQIFVHFFVIHSIFIKEYTLAALFLNVLITAYAMQKTEKKLDQL